MLAIVAIVLVGQTASAQTQASYVALVEQYAAGDASGAVQLLATGTPRVSGEIVERMRQRPDRDVRSAVMLHTELAAVWLVNGRTPPAIVQIDNAKRLLRILTADATRRGRSKAFAIQWYAFTTSLYAAQGLFEVASRTVRDGLTDFPGAPELYVADGTVHEERASFAGDGNALTADGNPTSNQSQRLLEAASAEYQRALAADGDLAAAHPHRGWVLFRLGDRRAAASLDLALAHATDDRVRYLAHLFRGAVAEASKDLERARSEFEAAKGVGPYQTAYIALGRVEESLGHGDRARTLAAEYAQLESTREDPWWDYRIGGGITGALDWLRHEARRP